MNVIHFVLLFVQYVFINCPVLPIQIYVADAHKKNVQATNEQ
ncbi:MAG: hypothetical protein JWR61_1925 [Ferruginibacter sp.]|nr:hypothetical protein [Ferruginibacter sp.]